jgi:hypothetical protein
LLTADGPPDAEPAPVIATLALLGVLIEAPPVGADRLTEKLLLPVNGSDVLIGIDIDFAAASPFAQLKVLAVAV